MVEEVKNEVDVSQNENFWKKILPSASGLFSQGFTLKSISNNSIVFCMQ